MQAKDLKEKLLQLTYSMCGHEDGINYLGMSYIGACPRFALKKMTNGLPELGMAQAIKFYEGYLAERDMLARLDTLGLLLETKKEDREVVASFDPRFAGHIDGILSNGDLLEIKSLYDDENCAQIMREGVPTLHRWQVQAYMRYHRMNFKRAQIIYKSRATGKIWVCTVDRNDNMGRMIELRAKSILKHKDENTTPDCECGRCL